MNRIGRVPVLLAGDGELAQRFFIATMGGVLQAIISSRVVLRNGITPT